jgi:hypothetical protein
MKPLAAIDSAMFQQTGDIIVAEDKLSLGQNRPVIDLFVKFEQELVDRTERIRIKDYSFFIEGAKIDWEFFTREQLRQIDDRMLALAHYLEDQILGYNNTSLSPDRSRTDED